MSQHAEFGNPTFCKILPELPKPEKLRRQIRKNGGYDMVPAYSPEEMYKYGELCVSEAIAALQAEPVPMTDSKPIAWARHSTDHEFSSAKTFYTITQIPRIAQIWKDQGESVFELFGEPKTPRPIEKIDAVDFKESVKTFAMLKAEFHGIKPKGE